MSGDALARLEAALADALEAVRDLRRGDVANDPPAEPRRRRTLTEDEAAEHKPDRPRSNQASDAAGAGGGAAAPKAGAGSWYAAAAGWARGTRTASKRNYYN